jgi:hypothetical protein
MSNLFENVLTNARGVENRLIGPTYPYYKNIKTPTEIGINDNGTIEQMSKDIDGLIQYVELLVSGNSKASTTEQPLGNKFFLKTGAKCRAINMCTDPSNVDTCMKVNRYIYIDNVPDGNVKFISSGMGVDFSDYKGLIPGAMKNLDEINPYAIMRAFLSGSTPPCQRITMETITNDNVRSSESRYVTLADISSMKPCTFSDGINPITGKKCKQAFQNLNPEILMPDDTLAQLYFAGLGALGLFILYRLMEKTR